jgi:hypothetical protein
VLQDDDLIVKLADDLDDVTRQRYISEAKRATGWKQRRRFLPLGLAGAAEGAHRGIRQQSIAWTAGAAVTGIAAAVILPVVLGDGHHAPHRPPTARLDRLPAPAHPKQPPAPPKATPRSAPSRPAHGGSVTSPATSPPTPPASIAPTLPAHAVPIDLKPALPRVPMPLPRPVVTPTVPVLPKLSLTVRPATRSFCVRLHVASLRARLGCHR